MPGYRKHLLGGGVAFAVTLSVIIMNEVVIIKNIIPVFGWALCSLAGSLFPDIDIKSKGQKYFYWMILVLLLYFTYYERFVPLACLAIVATTPMLVNHRGIFHNMWFLLLAFAGISYALIIYIPKYSDMILLHMFFFVAGVISHIWLDVGFMRMLRLRWF